MEENGLRENTLVVFNADNGMNMGHHGIWGKNNVTGRGQIGLAGSEDYAKPFADDIVLFHDRG